MKDAFTESADFSRMCRNTRKGDLKISGLAHKSTFELDEDGVVASAATAAIFSSRSAVRIVTIDRPFYFFVHKTDAPAVLFAGRYVGPE